MMTRGVEGFLHLTRPKQHLEVVDAMREAASSAPDIAKFFVPPTELNTAGLASHIDVLMKGQLPTYTELNPKPSILKEGRVLTTLGGAVAAYLERDGTADEAKAAYLFHLRATLPEVYNAACKHNTFKIARDRGLGTEQQTTESRLLDKYAKALAYNDKEKISIALHNINLEVRDLADKGQAETAIILLKNAIALHQPVASLFGRADINPIKDYQTKETAWFVASKLLNSDSPSPESVHYIRSTFGWSTQGENNHLATSDWEKRIVGLIMDVYRNIGIPVADRIARVSKIMEICLSDCGIDSRQLADTTRFDHALRNTVKKLRSRETRRPADAKAIVDSLGYQEDVAKNLLRLSPGEKGRAGIARKLRATSDRLWVEQ